MLLPKDISPEALESFINGGGLAELALDKVPSPKHDSPSRIVENSADLPKPESSSGFHKVSNASNVNETNPLPSSSYQTLGNTNYPGDIIDETPKPQNGYVAMNFESPAELLAYFDDN